MFVFLIQSDADKLMQDRLTKLHTILGGDTTISLHLQFLIRANKTDLLILKNTKVKFNFILKTLFFLTDSVCIVFILPEGIIDSLMF